MFKHALDRTDTAYLSLFTSNDAAALFRLIDRNREHLGAWLRISDMTLTEEDSAGFIERTRLRYAQEEGKNADKAFDPAMPTVDTTNLSSEEATKQIEQWVRANW